MKILVTGSTGFIGYHLALKLLEQGHEIIGLDNITDYYDGISEFVNWYKKFYGGTK